MVIFSPCRQPTPEGSSPVGRQSGAWLRHAIGGSVLLVLLAPLSSGAAAGGLTLTEAVRLALANNQEHRQTLNRTEAQRIAMEQSRDNLAPDLQLGLQGRRLDARGEGHAESASADFSSSLNLFAGFGDQAAIQAASNDLAASLYELDRAGQTLTCAVTSGYAEALIARGQIGVRSKTLAQNRAQEEEVAAMVQAGTRPRSELYQQQAETARAELALIEAEQGAETSLLQLRETLGLEPATRLLLADPTVLPTAATFGDLIPEEGLQAGIRSDLLAREEDLRAAESRIEEARAGYWPSLDLSLAAGTDYSSRDAGDVGSQFDDHRYSSIGLNLNLPIFDRNRTRHQVALAGIDRSNARLELERLRLQAITEFDQAQLDYRTGLKRVEAADRGLAAAAEALAAMEERYRVGAATLVELSQLRSDHAAAEYDVLNSRYSLISDAMAVACAAGDEETIRALLQRWEMQP